MARAYFMAAKNDGEKRFLETCENNSIVSKFYPLGDLDLNYHRDVPDRVAELSYYANAIADKMYGQSDWCEFRDKMKAICKRNRLIEGEYCLYCDDEHSLDAAVELAIEYDGPIVVNCKVIPDMCTPLVAPGSALDDMMLNSNKKINSGEVPS